MKKVESLGRRSDGLDRGDRNVAEDRPQGPRRWGGVVLGLAAFSLLAVGLALGAWRHGSQYRETSTPAGQHHEFVPKVRVATVKASDPITLVSLPATTSAFSVANLFARASGYIDKRNVDIGDRVKEGQLLVQITAPELDHQIAEAQATRGQTKASVDQTQANLDLARITWARDKPLIAREDLTQQQGSVDVQNLKALEAGLVVAQANEAAQEAQIKVLNQQKAYQRVVAPFDGVITQRNIDVGSLVQADTTSGTFMFTIMQSNVIRTQVFVPQDQAFGLGPGVEAVVRVPEIPNRTFPGKVTRIAEALQPDTRTMLTEIDIPNPDGALAVGLYCTVELHIPRKTPSLLVPAEAIIFNRDGVLVAVVEDSIAHIRKVAVARDLGTTVEVRDGVKAGDQVILNPAVNLVEGSRVRISAQGSAPTAQ
jgi:RND family efflux transporter MFP subunit